MRILLPVLVLLALAASGCGSSSLSEGSGGQASQPGSRCERAGQIVTDYDTLAPGSSRREYLVLLHKLQRDCPQVADQLGLTGEFLPRCNRLNQENCTMYRRS
jgi:hypothetical protein